MTFTNSLKQGWKTEFCLSCVVDGKTYAKDTIKFEQKLDCKDSLTKLKEVSKSVIEYSGKDSIGDWSKFFKNSDEKICPITSCKVLKAGCKESSKKLEMKENFKLFAKTTKEDNGWNETVCIECKNGESNFYQTITFDKFEVQQTRNCKKALILSKTKPTIEKLTENYDKT